MTSSKLYNQHFKILADLVENVDQAKMDGGYDLDKWIYMLDSLDKEYAAAQQSPQERFYAFLRTHDALYASLLQAQGSFEAQCAILRAMMGEIARYIEYSAQADKGEGS